MKDYIDYMKTFYKDYFSGCSASELIRNEDQLSKLIDDDSFSYTLLIDEALMLYELVRDECVRRVALMAHSQDQTQARTAPPLQGPRVGRQENI